MLKILSFPFLLVWKTVRFIIWLVSLIFSTAWGIISRILGIFKGIFYGLLGGSGRVGWKGKK